MANDQGQAGTIASLLFLGIDLSGQAANPSAWALLDSEPRLRAWGLAHDDELVALTREHRPVAIAIDAPLSLPRGLHCLEESCPCQPSSLLAGRVAERALSRQGIPSYYVTKRTFIKEMVYRGIDLRRTLEGQGHRVIEVYPYASKVALWGKDLPKKQTQVGRLFLAERLAERVAGIEISTLPSHHLLDALVAAYTACLEWQAQAEMVGDAEEGAICVPRRPYSPDGQAKSPSGQKPVGPD